MIRKALLTTFSLNRSAVRPLGYLSPKFTFCQNKSQTQIQQLVEAKVFEVLRSAAKCDQSKLARTATFEQLGFDSLDSVQLVVAMEQNLGLDIPNQQAQKISTVQAAINTFYRHLNQKANNANAEPKTDKK